MKSNMRKMNILIILGIFLVISGVSSLNFNINISINDGSMEIWDETNLKIAQYLNLTGFPIYIDDANPAFNWSKTAADNDWCNGSGTFMDPYIIEYVLIDGENTVGRVIEIRNSNVYFIIRNCFVTGSSGGGDNAGIFLYNTNNSQLINNDVSNNNGKGISLNYGCNNNTILFNTALNNRVGVGLNYYCDNNIVSDNFLTQNWYRGIYLFTGSDKNTILRNTVNDGDDYGIQLETNCDNNNITGNTILRNVNHGIYLWKNCDNNTISGNNANENYAHGIAFLDGCHYNTISGNTANNNLVHGIRLRQNCDYNTISGNTANDNGDAGILLREYSDNNTVSGNMANGNYAQGILLREFSDDNTISGNTIYYTIQYGVWLESTCNDNLFYLNGFIGNGNHARDSGNNQWDNGIYGNYWDDYSGYDLFPMDGIGDIPHSLPVDNYDTKPLMYLGWDTDGDTFGDSDEVDYGTNPIDASWYPMPNLKVSHLSSVATYEGTSFMLDFSVSNNGIWKAEGVIIIVRCEELGLTLFNNSNSPLTLDVDETEYIAVNCPAIDQTGTFILSLTIDPGNTITETYSSKDGSARTGAENDNSQTADLGVSGISTAEPPAIPGYSLFILIGACCLISIVLIKKRRK